MYITCYFIFFKHYKTPLYLASQEGHTAIVQMLVRAGADVNIPDVVSGTIMLQHVYWEQYSESHFMSMVLHVHVDV